MKKFLHLVSIFIVVCSCTSNKNEIGTEIELKGQRIEIDPAYYGTSPILLYDKWLISNSSSKSTKCVISILEDGRLKDSRNIFHVGNGKDEFHDIALTKDKDSTLYVLDYPNSGNQLLVLTKMPDGINSVENPETWKRFSLVNIPSFRCAFDTFIPLSDSTFLVPGATYHEIGHIFSIVDYKKQTITPLDYWPSDGMKCDSLAKHSVYTDNCRIYGNDDGQFVYMCGEERFAFIFTIEGSTINVKKELYSFLPNYRCIENGNYLMNTRSGKALMMDVNEKNIYAFLIENKLEKNYVSRIGNIIEVFDWDGTLKKIIKLDKSGSYIKVSEENDGLYLFTNNPESGDTEIWMYDLKDI